MQTLTIYIQNETLTEKVLSKIYGIFQNPSKLKFILKF